MFRLFVPTLLVLLLVAQHHATAEGADPRCRKGIAKGRACCPKRCGQCGGANCFKKSRRFKTRCCAGAITDRRNNVKNCNVANPPCRLLRGSGGTSAPPRTTKTPTKPGVPPGTSTLQGRWRTAPVDDGSRPSPRHEACAVMVNGNVVLVGGRGVNKETSIYNAQTKRWRKGKGPGNNVEIHHFQCVAINGRVFIISSWTGGFPFESNNKFVYIYDVRLDVWRTKKGLPAGRNRGGGAAVRFGDLIYLVAGNRGGHGDHATALNWMDAYNWKSGQWLARRFPDMPGPGRDHVGGAIVGNELCVAGGRDSGVGNFFDAVKKETYCYNFKKNTWSQRANFPSPRAGAMTGRTCDGRMMIAGGEGDNKAYDRVDVFDGRVWKRAPNMVRGRHGSGLAVSKCSCGHLFIPSGSGGLGGGPELDSTEEYIPRGAPLSCANGY